MLCPSDYDIDVYKQYSNLIDDICYQKLLICDLCVIVTPEHIGESTKKRIRQSIELGKPVYVWKDNEFKLYIDVGNM